MEYTLVEKYQQNKKQNIVIRPFFNPNVKNMGLEQYKMVLYENVWHEESLTCIEMNGVKRYVTGLNEFAPEIKKLSEEEKKAKIKEIRSVVAKLEAELAANVIDVDDKEFWNKVTLLRPDNDKFWSRISIKCGNEPVYLDPSIDPYDLIKIYAINAGGFSIVAKSLKEAKAINTKKFYLDEIQETVSERTELTKLRNKAISELQKLYDKNQTKLFYIAKCLDNNSFQYTKNTPHDILYENMDAYINGDGGESAKKKAASSFIEYSGLSMEDLKLKAIIKDATNYKLLFNRNGWIETSNNIKLGKTISEAMLFLKDPINDEVFKQLSEGVEFYWK